MLRDIKYPSNEIVWVSYYVDEKLMYIITTKSTSREWYYLYKLEAEQFKKINNNRNPLELEKLIK